MARRIKYLNHQQQMQALSTIRQTKGWQAERDLFIFQFILGTGVRVGTLSMLNVGDVRNKQWVTFRDEISKKGNGYRIPLGVDNERLVARFLGWKLKQRESIHDDAPLLLSRDNNRLSKRSIQDAVTNWLMRAGLVEYAPGKNPATAFSAHSLRHSFAMNRRAMGDDICRVKDLMGHATITSTQVYFQATDEELEETMNSGKHRKSRGW
jgi:site-specific recombinase XerD